MLALLRPCLVATFAVASSLAQTTTEMTVDALVCDPSGKPVAGVEFGDRWSCANTRWSATLGCNPPDNRAPLTSDAEGRLRGIWVEDPFATPLLGLSADRRLAGFVHGSYDPDTHRPQVVGRIVLQPATVLRGAMRTSAPMPADAPRAFVLGFAHPMHAGLQSGVPFGLDANTFALPLPPGTYSVTVRIGRSGATGRTALLEAGRETLDLGPISVPLVPFDLLGEVLPDWHVDRAENVAFEKASLAAFRGKPLLVCFDEFGPAGTRAVTRASSSPNSASTRAAATSRSCCSTRRCASAACRQNLPKSRSSNVSTRSSPTVLAGPRTATARAGRRSCSTATVVWCTAAASARRFRRWNGCWRLGIVERGPSWVAVQSASVSWHAHGIRRLRTARSPPRARHPTLQHTLQVALAERLREIVVHAGRQARLAIALHRVGGQGHDRRAPAGR